MTNLNPRLLSENRSSLQTWFLFSSNIALQMATDVSAEGLRSRCDVMMMKYVYLCVKASVRAKSEKKQTAFQSSVRSRRHVMMRRSEASHMEHAGQSSSFFHRRSRHDMFYSGNFICPHAVSLQSFLHIHVLNTGTRPASE